MTDLEFHPVADIFPMMTDQEFADLVEDIGAHGLREPIWLHHDGRIIDGRNRYRACQKASVEPTFRTYDEDDEGLVAFAVSLNLKRRHLKEGQRAMVADRIATMKQGERTDLQRAEEVESEPSANLRKVDQTTAAELLNVSERSVTSARKVRQQGIPELAAKVESGEVAVSTAAVLAEAPEEEQREVVASGNNKNIVRRANEIRQRKRQNHRPDAEVMMQQVIQHAQKAALVADEMTPAQRARIKEQAALWEGGLFEALEVLQHLHEEIMKDVQ